MKHALEISDRVRVKFLGLFKFEWKRKQLPKPSDGTDAKSAAEANETKVIEAEATQVMPSVQKGRKVSRG